MVRADLLAAAEAAGALTDEVIRETQNALRVLAEDADAVLLTCSTLGPALEPLDVPSSAVAFVRADAALARAAVACAGPVVTLVATPLSLAPTRALIEAAARDSGSSIQVELVEGAWDAFKAGDRAGYLRRVAQAAELAVQRGARSVVLAQASMAPAAQLARVECPILTCPAAALQAVARRGSEVVRKGAAVEHAFLVEAVEALQHGQARVGEQQQARGEADQQVRRGEGDPAT